MFDPVPALARLAHAPIDHGMVVPHITLTHRNRTRPVWGKIDPARLRETFVRKLCQICGDPLGERVVVYLRPRDYLRGLGVEPGVHPECGYYSRRACPMLAGRVQRYNPTPHDRLTRCEDPACGCRYWTVPDRDHREASRVGQPAEPWYEVWLSLDDYTIVSDAGDGNYPPAVGVDLRRANRLKVRKVRDAAPDTEDQQPIDLLKAVVALEMVLGLGG
ncbi:hypothetical protein AB4305_03325 [Nocardia sp. 2YAB30]|uniref:hypothetical protein n=1 Tax=unclassified Nocardia TaxID=2637762 RepID=UPI003F9B02D9